MSFARVLAIGLLIEEFVAIAGATILIFAGSIQEATLLAVFAILLDMSRIRMNKIVEEENE